MSDIQCIRRSKSCPMSSDTRHTPTTIRDQPAAITAKFAQENPVLAASGYNNYVLYKVGVPIATLCYAPHLCDTCALVRDRTHPFCDRCGHYEKLALEAAERAEREAKLPV